MNNNILRLEAVKKKTGLSRSQIYAMIKRDEFPSQIKLTERSSGWIESEIDQFIADRVAASRQGQRGTL